MTTIPIVPIVDREVVNPPMPVFDPARMGAHFDEIVAAMRAAFDALPCTCQARSKLSIAIARATGEEPKP